MDAPNVHHAEGRTQKLPLIVRKRTLANFEDLHRTLEK